MPHESDPTRAPSGARKTRESALSGAREKGDNAPSGGAPMATLQGGLAILLWASLASLTALVPEVPPFQLTAIAFAEAALVGLAYTRATGGRLVDLAHVPAASVLLGVYGLLGYHACYFLALKTAPAVEANLVNYLWPLLIVVFSGLLPARHGGMRLRWWHLAGAALGFLGTALLVAGSGSTGGPATNGTGTSSAIGYLAAFAAAIVWSSYSVASRVLAAVPSSAVTASCAATALGALVGHLVLEDTQWPATALGWTALAAQGLGPVGLAFYLWDAGMKRGDMRLLGVVSYATPLLSTLLLVALGLATPTPVLWLAAALITTGAALAGLEAIRSLRS